MTPRTLHRLAAHAIAALGFALCALAPAVAAELPQRLAPTAPFPQILAEAPTIEDVAPGVEEGDYELQTADGPIAIYVIAADLHRTDVSAGAVLSHDTLVSAGETVEAMAQRTGAVAGINGDYFDIGETGEPLDVLVQNGTLLRTPSQRYAAVVERDGSVAFAPLTFTGDVQVGGHDTPLDAVNEFPPPDGGVSLLTPAFGGVAPVTNMTLVSLDPLDGTPPFATYRTTGIADNTVPQPPGYYLAVGIGAYGSVGVPDPGTVVAASGDLAPIPLNEIATAIGGGPMVLHGGAWFDDPNGPAGAPTLTRIPASAVATAPDGTLFLIEVDGRQPSVSIGVTRPQLVAIMRALGATEGLALDGGGSSTLVAREPGDASTSLRNSPSDGRERPVADGLFVYSNAPLGPPSRVVVRPGVLRALTGAVVPLRFAVTDDAGHVTAAPDAFDAVVMPASLGAVIDGAFVARRAGVGTLRVASGALHADVAIEVLDRAASARIFPENLDLAAGARAQLRVLAFDANGYPLALPPAIAWSATLGTIAPEGGYVAGDRDATVRARFGSSAAAERIAVGEHESPLALPASIAFLAAPKGGPGGVTTGPCAGCFTLAYDFRAGGRAAYAMLNVPLPPGAIGVSFDAQGIATGALLRVSALNSIGERVFLPAAALDTTSWRHVVVRFPAELSAAKSLEAIYALDGIGERIVRTAGSVTIRGLRVLFAGSQGSGQPEP